MDKFRRGERVRLLHHRMNAEVLPSVDYGTYQYDVAGGCIVYCDNGNVWIMRRDHIESLDPMGPLNELAAEAKEWRESKGFETPTSLEQDELMLGKLMLVVTEVAEAAEAVRDNDLENFGEEMADIFIRCFDICGTMGIDLDKAVRDKMEKNWKREHKHGRASAV